MFLHCISLLMPTLSSLGALYFSQNKNNTLKRSATIFKKRFAASVKSLEPLYIFGVKKLGHCAITHSLKDGCLQAYLLAVIVFLAPLSLRHTLIS
jgi:hypothetical protein